MTQTITYIERRMRSHHQEGAGEVVPSRRIEVEGAELQGPRETVVEGAVLRVSRETVEEGAGHWVHL